jgi:hypothetical protein
MADDWPAALEDALRRACSVAVDCVTVRAIEDLATRNVIPAPTTKGGWLLENDDNRLRLRVIVGRALHVVSGDCAHHDATKPDDKIQARLRYKRVPFRTDAAFQCTVVRGELKSQGEPNVETETRWSLHLVDGATIDLVVKPQSALLNDAEREEAEQQDGFARAAVRALSEPTLRGPLQADA